jgi:putative hydrolase of the HAD superfamily
MILFDYGHTLIYEPGFDFQRGAEALFKCVKSNKNDLTSKQVGDFSQELFMRAEAVRKLGFELHEWQLQRFLFEYMELDLSVSYTEAEKILWNGASAGAVMPGADTMIDYINAKGIRSGVVSNIGWSGSALAERINRMLPRNKFEFIIASSEYMFRKPSLMLFELALRKAGLDAADVWFCGDNVKADVEGSAAAGMSPVWYEEMSVENPWRDTAKGTVPACAHLHIHDWQELINTLENTK